MISGHFRSVWVLASLSAAFLASSAKAGDPSLNGLYGESFSKNKAPPETSPVAGSDAINAGTDLSGTFTDDIDGDTRPISTAWEIGADETTASGATALRIPRPSGSGQYPAIY